ncbi:hypothetical protein M0638_13615 [Roseomonas sp. NAR14]|uniref:Uncharacterized protein n=1 Tax=Roseomonas acroporae TaxID=2937791 RepID=A0A9X1Y949_9PROT|nr:hypothetical protein [Roseomonas acroporae]MCK8785422.1 hypothetical protein [Roseomonas acroporae]
MPNGMSGGMSGGVPGAAPAAPPDMPSGPVLSALQPVPLRPGVNRVERFAPDGRPAQVVQARRGGARDVFMVLMPSRPDGTDWSLVGFDLPRLPDEPAAGGSLDVVADRRRPGGEEMLRALRFARGRVDGVPATLLLVASRDPAAPGEPATGPATAPTTAGPAFVTYLVLRLVRTEGGAADAPPDRFAPIRETRSATRFCNAEVALGREFGLLPRLVRQDGDTPDGCRDPVSRPVPSGRERPGGMDSRGIGR